ncbi:3'-5' exonuclease [Cyanobium sp. Morenito 9A2]|uniref:3'-5' exonuclease n=1 Tax=Cyanobium sp. Morenito 9A2 TaxID=2823718 RepID=UPI0020CD0C5B|nr:3'-5' exonuclease [Cyanobium sp. Morenito 9A2]MCP9849466.1 3'-5' exonuclease [Cyanobium sp. Morenito 9A2]
MATEAGDASAGQLPLWGERSETPLGDRLESERLEVERLETELKQALASLEDPGATPFDQSPAQVPAPAARSRSVALPRWAGSEPFQGWPERLLIIDTETTGLDPSRGACIELGAILFAVAPRAVLGQISFLLPCRANPCEAINGIPAAVSRLDQPWEPLRTAFERLVEAADAVVAHNAAFDRQWFGQGPLAAIERPWICSMDDIRWPAELHLRPQPSLRDLALAHGIPVWAAHRALTDCTYLAQVFERRPDLEALLQSALEPRRLYKARVSYDERQLAREAGFRWNEPVKGAWTRRLSEREVAALSFAVQAIELEPDQRRSA